MRKKIQFISRLRIVMQQALFISCLFYLQTAYPEVISTIATSKDACKILIEKAQKEFWFSNIKKGRLTCEDTSDTNNNFFIIRLSNGTPFDKSHDYPHSTLLGWFAVQKHGGAVMSYDVAEDVILPLEYGKSKSQNVR